MARSRMERRPVVVAAVQAVEVGLAVEAGHGHSCSRWHHTAARAEDRPEVGTGTAAAPAQAGSTVGNGWLAQSAETAHDPAVDTQLGVDGRTAAIGAAAARYPAGPARHVAAGAALEKRSCAALLASERNVWPLFLRATAGCQNVDRKLVRKTHQRQSAPPTERLQGPRVLMRSIRYTSCAVPDWMLVALAAFALAPRPLAHRCRLQAVQSDDASPLEFAVFAMG